ncbi:MAG: D-arabinono-1,4-lactone oxidase [Myxococcota bacterium]
MTRDEALAAAIRIVRRPSYGPSDTREMLALEAEYPGIGLDAALTAVDPEHRSRAESTVCDEVDHWADLRWSRTDVVRPDALGELVDLLREAKTGRKTLRMVGAARSDSLASTPAPPTSLLASCALDQVLPVLKDALADGVDPAVLYRCESGRQAKEVIDDLQNAGLALANMGSGQFQGIVGAIMTATHGSGLKLPDMSGQTVAMQVVTLDDAGEVVVQQLARAGTFDPTRFAAAVADSPVPIELVEDEDAFLAAVVGLGCFGLVYSVTLRAVPQYWLHETRLPARWSELKAVLLDEAADIRNYEVLVSPLATELDGPNGTKVLDHECLVTRRIPVDATAPSGKRPVSMALASTPVGHFVAGATLVEATRHPLTVVPWMLHTGVTSTQVDGYTDVSRKVLQLNLDLNAIANELEIPVEKTVEAVDALLDMAATSWAEMNERIGAHTDPVETAFDALKAAWREVPLHTSPISLRFVDAADAMISMAHGGARCMIEMPMPGCTHYDEEVKKGHDFFHPRELELYEAYLAGRMALYRATEDALRASVSARPHWGLVNFIDGDQARSSYARWDDWKSRYDMANRFGVFNGPMTDQLGISVEPPSPEMPGQALVGDARWSELDGAGRLVLRDGLGWHLFDQLAGQDEQRQGCGRVRKAGIVCATSGGLGKPRAMLTFRAGQPELPMDWEVARSGDARGTAALSNGVLRVDGAAGAALRAYLRSAGVSMRDDPSLPVRFHVRDLATGRLDLLTDG